MVSSKIINLLLADAGPKVFADKFHQIQLVLELWILASQLLNQPISGIEADVLEIRKSLFPFC